LVLPAEDLEQTGEGRERVFSDFGSELPLDSPGGLAMCREVFACARCEYDDLLGAVDG
jgi:hypothetical protein